MVARLAWASRSDRAFDLRRIRCHARLEAGEISGRREVLNADQGIEPPLIEVVFDLGGQPPDVGELVGLRRADGGQLRVRDARGDHNGAPLR